MTSHASAHQVMAQAFPKPKPDGQEEKPPPEPTSFQLARTSGTRPEAPGTGKPPANLGNPTSPQERTDHLIWLLGRASNLRRQAREGKPLKKHETKELVLAINLASRLHHGILTTPTPEKKPLPVAQFAPEPEAPKASTDMRSNPALEEAFAAPSESKPAAKPEGDLRHNPALDEAFGVSTPSEAKPSAPAISAQATPSPSGPASNKPSGRAGFKLPALPSQRPVKSSHEEVRSLATNIAGNFSRSNPNHGDIGGEISHRLGKNPQLADAFRRRYGITETDSHEEMGRKFHASHRGGWSKDPELKKPKPRKRAAKSFSLPLLILKTWDHSKHPRSNLGHFASKLKEHVAGLSGHESEHAHADTWAGHLHKLTQSEVHTVLARAGIEGGRHTDSKSSLIQRARNRLTARARARDRAEV